MQARQTLIETIVAELQSVGCRVNAHGRQQLQRILHQLDQIQSSQEFEKFCATLNPIGDLPYWRKETA